MFKRTTALFLLTLFAGQLTASFLHFDCNMDCCQEDVVSCCSIDPVDKECPTLGSNCDLVVFLPILSGPAAHVEIDGNITVNDLNVSAYVNHVAHRIVDYYETHPLAEPPPAFNLPLLI